MEGKVARASFIVLLILGMILAQAHVEAKSCCRSTTARNCYNVCRLPGTPRATCAKLCDCKITSGTSCPSDYPKFYCMLGCSSSQCSTISNLKNSDADEEVVRCKNACTELCNEGSSHEVYYA